MFIINYFHRFDDVSNLYHQLQAVETINKREKSAQEKEINKIKDAILLLKNDYIEDIADHPEKSEIWRALGEKFRKIDPSTFKEIQQTISTIQQQGKILRSCKKFGVELEEYQQFIEEFDGNIDGDSLNADGQTPLRKAIADKNTRMIKVLVDLGANLNFFDKNGWTPLKYAMHKNSKIMVRLLISLGADLNFCDKNGWTPLMYAIKSNSKVMVRLLDYFGADLNLCNNTIYTPLKFAIKQNSKGMVRLLYRLGANLNYCDKTGSTPIKYAIDQNSHEMLEFLRDLGANLNFCDTSGLTPLKYAMDQNSKVMIRLLKDLGADLNFCDHTGLTPLKYAVIKNSKAMVCLLKDLGADLNFCDRNGFTPLTYAIEKNLADMVQLLIKVGANPNYCDSNGFTPLTYAIEKNSVTLVRLLKDLGADVNLFDKGNFTPLRYAISLNSEAMVCLLKDLGANINLSDESEWTPLTYAITLESIPMVRLLKLLGADFNSPCKAGRTPLAYALLKNNIKMARLLKTLGADVNLGKEIEMSVLLAHIWGLKGNIKLGSPSITLKLESMFAQSALKLLETCLYAFFDKLGKDARLSEEHRIKMKKAVSSSYPYVQISSDEIVKNIKNGQPQIIEGGISLHGIAFVVSKENLVVCNRGLGRELLACEFYELPNIKLTSELIDKLKAIYPDITAFKKMLDDLNLQKSGGYNHKNQGGGHCAWSSAKTAIGVLFRKYAKNEKEGFLRYKEFTAFCRVFILEKYFEEVGKPNLQILGLVDEKLSEKEGLGKARKLIAKAK